jgi:hypothetical protein
MILNQMEICEQNIWNPNSGNYDKSDTKKMAANPWPMRKSSWAKPTMNLDMYESHQ